MNLRTLSPLPLLLTCVACVVPDGARPSATFGIDLATQNNRRGVVLNERLVAQPSVSVALPAEQDGTIVARTWGNIDLSNSNGDAWVPDADRFGFSQLDWSLLYEQVLGEHLLTMGFITYNLPKGGMLPQSAATSEFMIEGSTRIEFWDLQPRLALHYDYDAVDGVYLRTGVAREFPIDDKLSGDVDLHLGWMDDNQAYYTYGGMMQSYGKSGLADLRLTGRLTYALGPHMSAHGFAAFSEVLTAKSRDNLDDVGIDSAQFWVGAGVTWSY